VLEPTEVVVPTPLPAAATTMLVTGGPAALTFADAQDRLFVADRSGLVWTMRAGQPSLTRPYSVAGDPVGLVTDPAAGRLYLAVRSPPGIAVLDTTSGEQVASVPLPARPGDLRLDASLATLYVVLPERDALQILDARDLKTIRITPELKQVTGIALDESTHTVYLSHLDGNVSVIDGKTGMVTSRWALTGTGLAGLAVANRRVFAINGPGRELVQIDLSSGEVGQLTLAVEPASVVVGPLSGAIYLLDIETNAIVKLDPGDGSELARAYLGDAGPAVASELQPETAWLRPRMAVSARDERIYVIEPEAARLALSPPGF
jgi:DNA-binding beta-propeller fold protein YncE